MGNLSWYIWFAGMASLILSLEVQPSELIISIHRAGNAKLSVQDEGTAAPVPSQSTAEDADCTNLFVTESAREKITHIPISAPLCEDASCDQLTFKDKLLGDGKRSEVSNGTSLHFSRALAAMYSLCSASLVGLSGILPLLILPNVGAGGQSLKEGNGAKNLNRLLSFAVGGLLGDVFLHLLPESWNHLEHTDSEGNHSHMPAMVNGLWILFGLMSFCFLEKLFPDSSELDSLGESEAGSHQDNVEQYSEKSCNVNENNNKIQNGNCAYYQKAENHQNGSVHQLANGDCKNEKEKTSHEHIKISGYLNLFANFIDNFTHGLAIGGSYLVSRRVGLLTTMAILLHEIPHEVGDFAILLRAGFDRWKAAKLQVLTATGGLMGALFALMADSAKGAGDSVAWILPFTSGGFLYIALCTVVPDLLKETSLRESFIQLLLIISAIAVMGLVSIFE